LIIVKVIIAEAAVKAAETESPGTTLILARAGIKALAESWGNDSGVISAKSYGEKSREG